jgi:hypothetical protein
VYLVRNIGKYWLEKDKDLFRGKGKAKLAGIVKEIISKRGKLTMNSKPEDRILFFAGSFKNAVFPRPTARDSSDHLRLLTKPE